VWETFLQMPRLSCTFGMQDTSCWTSTASTAEQALFPALTGPAQLRIRRLAASVCHQSNKADQ
jgi:hypothetical protein